MSMSLIAILVSLAMMLTGVGADGMPAEASRVLRISNIELSINGQSIPFESALKLGVSTDGQKALFDFGVEKGGETLLPVQLSAEEDRLVATAFGQSFGVPAAALNALMEQMQPATTQLDPESQKLLSFITDEYMPAYIGLIEAASDPERKAEIEEKVEAIVTAAIDRGEGVEDTIVLGDNQEFSVVRYNYTLDAQKMFELSDAVYTCDEALANYYNAMLKMYSMMPEESGLNGITSFADLGAKMNLDMQMVVTETVSEADGLKMMDAVMTINMPAITAQGADGQTQSVELPPMEITIAAYKMGEEEYDQADFDYEYEGTAINFHMTVEKSGEEYSADMDMAMSSEGNAITMEMNAGKDDDGEYCDMTFDVSAVDANGNAASVGTVSVDASSAKDGDGEEYTFEMKFDANGQGTLTLDVEGSKLADGTGDADVELELEAQGMKISLSFNAAVSAEAIASRANAANIVLIEDLSQEGLQALSQDPAFQSAAMQISSSMMLDMQKVMTDRGIQVILQLYSAMTGAAATTTTGPAA